MGLDMYLNGEKYLYKDEKVTIEPDILCGYTVKEVTVELMYWRKANAIHKWFVENIQEGEDNCGNYPVTEEKLHELHTIVCEVLEHRNRAPRLLPTQEGFFFCDTSYDKYYFEDLEYTKEGLEKLFKSGAMKEFSINYHSSW